MYAATNGYVDRIAADRVSKFHQDLLDRLRSQIADVLEAMAGGDWSDEIQRKLDDAIASFADDFGYDLDEEGQPISEEIEVDRKGRGSEREEPAEAAEEREQETAGATA